MARLVRAIFVNNQILFTESPDGLLFQQAIFVLGTKHMATIDELEKRVAALEAHVAKLPAGMQRFVPGEAPTLYQQVTAVLNQEQLHALENAGLNSVAQLKQAAASEDGFTRIDGLGKVADKKLRTALEGLDG